MKSIKFTDFKKSALAFIEEVVHGGKLALLCRRKPIAEKSPFTNDLLKKPSWKQPGTLLPIQGGDLSSAILEEREAGS